jgi:hypothetical protein
MKFLYRYYGNIDYAFDVVKNKRLYFSLPSEFNDPYDCLPKFSLLSCKNDGVEAWIEFLKDLELYENPGIGKEELEQKVSNTLNGLNHPSISWLKGYEQERKLMLKTFLNRIRICCFAKSPRNQMLWAHYAKNHAGLVFQFRKKFMADGVTGESKEFPVSYYKKPITLKQYNHIFRAGIKNPLEYARFQYCSKSQEWAGEDEIRFFSHNVYVPFKEEMLSGVIFGAKTPQHVIEVIQCQMRDWNKKPKFFIESEAQASHKQLFEKI